MAKSEMGASTSNPLGGEYQVFLNFRGPDTRRGFTNTLYNALKDVGIRVFMDDEEIRTGDIISGNLLQGINNSKLYITIFSQTYASSHWCLRELAKMVDNTFESKKDGNKKVILPIFYDVKPDDVKLKTKLYQEAISKLKNQKKFSFDDVETWCRALKKVDDNKGWKHVNYLGDGDLSKAVVLEVVKRLQTSQKEVTEDLVGMEARIEEVKELLNIDSGGVRVIGIYGMGGIGKTTLATIIFNQLNFHFEDGCSFLDNVRQTAKSKKGLKKLQKQLLFDISKSKVVQNINIHQWSNPIQETICNKKVLIVLDDVDKGNQIYELIGRNSLYAGTRILITTRDRSVLKIRKFSYGIEPYEMKGLSDKHALQLFSKHAFEDDIPPPDYYTLSKDIISTTGGLPLAVQAIGSTLFGQENKIIWEEMLEELKKTPHSNVLEKLRPTYDALDWKYQWIFLDIACFFIDGHKTEPMFVWNECELMPETAIDVLVKRCMIKDLGNKFWMHDQFRDLGRVIANPKIPQHPQKCTRLWDGDHIICELRSPEIKGSVQALCLQAESSNPITITAEQIKQFPHLQFLWLSNVICQGDFTGCLSKLKWISVHYSHKFYSSPEPQRYRGFEAINLPLENVVVVKLFGQEFTEDKVSSLIKGARKLKFLSLYGEPLEVNPMEFD